MSETARRFPEWTLVVWGGLLNGLWEFGHSSLYTDHVQGLAYIVWSRLHCTLGDVMILLAMFWITSAVFRTRHWMVQSKVAFPVAVFVMLGISYTTYSEWLNTQVVSGWKYTANMPTLFGIGITPLLQWLIIPLVVVAIIRSRRSIGKR